MLVKFFLVHYPKLQPVHIHPIRNTHTHTHLHSLCFLINRAAQQPLLQFQQQTSLDEVGATLTPECYGWNKTRVASEMLDPLVSQTGSSLIRASCSALFCLRESRGEVGVMHPAAVAQGWVCSLSRSWTEMSASIFTTCLMAWPYF